MDGSLVAPGAPGVMFGWPIGSVTLIVTAKPRLARWVRENARREQTDLVAALQPPGIDRSKVLVLCARGDEVRGWLRTWDVAAQAAFVTGGFLLWTIGAAARSNLPVVIDGVARSTLHAGLDQIRIFGFDGWALTVGALVVCAAWAVVMMSTSIVRWPGYWGEPLLANMLAEIGTEHAPRVGDSHSTYTFDCPSATVRSRIASGNLRHKAICGEAAVASAIVNWICGGLRPTERLVEAGMWNSKSV